MKIVEPQVELWEQEPTLEGAWHQIARATRVCYQSKPREGESDEAFVNRVILKPATREDGSIDFDKCHGAMLEHGTIYLTIPKAYFVERGIHYVHNKYSKVFLGALVCDTDNYYVTTNMRVILEHNLKDDLQFISAPTYHSGRTTFSIITDIGVTREFNRHRTFSVAEQSTRYCDLIKDKFGGELTFIKPAWRQKNKKGFILSFDNYDAFFADCEQTYKQLRQQGWKPEQARQVLPLGLKTQAVYTAFDADWIHFIRLRADNVSGKVHPNMNIIANKIKELFNNK